MVLGLGRILLAYFSLRKEGVQYACLPNTNI